MEHQSLYRKYRSQAFDDVIGQQHVTRTLQNALERGRVAHAYLFCGPRGTGKTTTARLLAKALNCVNGPTATPCNECALCKSITAGRSMDVVEVDAASETGIDNIREVIINNARYAPAEGRYKVYIIDEVHDLSRPAFDGLLKTLEEPPPHVVFVLATTETHKVPATIISRCQRFEFRRGSVEEVRGRVEFVAQSEGVSLEPAAAALIARAAQGGWRDALSLLEQVVSYAPERVTVGDVSAVLGAVDDESLAELTNRIIEQDPVGAVSALDGLLAAGKDVRQLLQNLADFLRDCLMESLSPGSETSRPLVKMEARSGVNLLELTARAERELRWNTQHRLVIELMLFRMTTPVAAPVAVSRMPAERQAEGDEEPSRSTQPQGAARTAPLRPTALSSRAATAPASDGPVDQAGAPDKPVAPPAIPAGTVISRDVVEQNWKTLLARVGARSRRLQALLREAVPTECDGQALTLQFRYEYHFLGIDEITARREVETVLAEVLGQPLRIVCKMNEAPTQRPRPRPATADGPLTDEDLRGIFPGWEVGEQ